MFKSTWVKTWFLPLFNQFEKRNGFFHVWVERFDDVLWPFFQLFRENSLRQGVSWIMFRSDVAELLRVYCLLDFSNCDRKHASFAAKFNVIAGIQFRQKLWHDKGCFRCAVLVTAQPFCSMLLTKLNVLAASCLATLCCQTSWKVRFRVLSPTFNLSELRYL